MVGGKRFVGYIVSGYIVYNIQYPVPTCAHDLCLEVGAEGALVVGGRGLEAGSLFSAEESEEEEETAGGQEGDYYYEVA
jgi:hypothetical protein